MLDWIGFRSRDSFNGKSRDYFQPQYNPDKYGLNRSDWQVYKGLLLFYMGNESLLPELVDVILRSAFTIAINERIKLSSLFGWAKMQCFDSELNGDRLPDGALILKRVAYMDITDEPDIIVRKKLTIRCGDYFICNDIDTGETIYVTDIFLNNEWMIDGTNSQFEDELYHDYLLETIKNEGTFWGTLLFWLLDWLIFDHTISQRMILCIEYVLSCLGIHGPDSPANHFTDRLILDPIRILTNPFYVTRMFANDTSLILNGTETILVDLTQCLVTFLQTMIEAFYLIVLFMLKILGIV